MTVLALLLLAAAALLLASVYQQSSLSSDFLMNIGATLLGVVATVVILDPLIERARTPEELIHPEFPYDKFIKGVEQSRHEVRILGAWPYVMEQPWREQFLSTLRRALGRRVRVRILVLHPGSKAAEQRAQDLGNKIDVSREITDVLNELYSFSLTLDEQNRDRLDIRIYSSLPPARMYRWDRRAISSFFPKGNLSGSDIRHYETSASSGLGEFVNEQFDIVWSDEDTQALVDYMAAEVDVVERGGTRRAFRVRYVCHEGSVYLVDRDLIEHLFSRQEQRPLIQLQTSIQGSSWRGKNFQAVPVQDQDINYMTDIGDRFRFKYGPDSPIRQGRELILLLRPSSVD